MADGALIIVGGTLLLTPGFITDIFGLFLLLPPTRAISRRLLKRFTIGRFAVVGVSAGGFGPVRARRAAAGARPSRDYDFEAHRRRGPAEGNGEPRLPRTDQG